ncbi:MAG TPA: hypothetical protein VHP57_01350 [Acidimicrobiia bacterium]|nr:hypothetical protein [Acidimicrobiia bacterium]
MTRTRGVPRGSAVLTDVSHSSPAAPPEQTEDGDLEFIAPGPMAAACASLVSELATDSSGIALIYRALDTLVEHFELNNAAVVIDEPTLGRQVFSFGRQALDDHEQLALARAPGLYTDPPIGPAQFDASMLTTLCAVSLRLDLARDDASRETLTPFDDHPSRLGRPLAAPATRPDR